MAFPCLTSLLDGLEELEGTIEFYFPSWRFPACPPKKIPKKNAERSVFPTLIPAFHLTISVQYASASLLGVTRQMNTTLSPIGSRIILLISVVSHDIPIAWYWPHLRTVGICCGRKSRWGRGCGPPATKGRLELLQGQPRSDGCSWFLNVFNFLLDLYLFGIVWIYTGVLITYSHTVDK